MDGDGCRVTVGTTTYVVREVGGRIRRQSKKYRSRQVHVVDPSGTTAISWTGAHYFHRAGTHVTVSDGRQFNFPIRRKGKRTLMAAVEEGSSEQPLISYRLKRDTQTWFPVWMSLRQIFSVEIVVSAEGLSVPERALVVALTSHLPWFYSIRPGGQY